MTRQVAVAIALAVVGVSPAAAQGGMGGGMGGGRGGPGGQSGGGMGAMKSPVDMIRENMENDDPVKFLLDRRKPLALTSVQRDSIERFRDELKDMQKPVYKSLEAEMKKMPEGQGRGGMSPGGGGGGMPPGEGGGSGGITSGGARGGRGSGGQGSEGRGRMGKLPDTVRVLVDRLADIQQSFGDRARGQLSTTQRAQADSLHSQWLADERKRAESRRPNR